MIYTVGSGVSSPVLLETSWW